MFEQPVVQLVAIVCMVIVALRVLNFLKHTVTPSLIFSHSFSSAN
jgi:hypothetical protein